MRGVEEAAMNGQGDVGVGKWGAWNTGELLVHLGLPSDLPARWPFFVEGKQTLRWHQIGAIIYLLDACFTEKPSLNRRGCFITDEVGLGKSATALAFITNFTAIIHLLHEKKIPPVLSK